MLHWLISNLIDCVVFMYEVIWVFVSYFKVIIPFTHSAPANAIDCAHTNERERYWYFGDSADRKNIPSVDGKRIVEEVFCYSNKITLPPSTILCIRIEIKSKTNSKKKTHFYLVTSVTVYRRFGQHENIIMLLSQQERHTFIQNGIHLNSIHIYGSTHIRCVVLDAWKNCVCLWVSKRFVLLSLCIEIEVYFDFFFFFVDNEFDFYISSIITERHLMRFSIESNE